MPKASINGKTYVTHGKKQDEGGGVGSPPLYKPERTRGYWAQYGSQRPKALWNVCGISGGGSWGGWRP